MATSESSDGGVIGVVHQSGGTSVYDTDTGSYAAAGFAGKWPAGTHLQPHLGSTTAALTNDVVRYTPIWVPEARTLAEIAVETTASASLGGVLRLGVYSSNSSGRPSTRLLDAGTVDATVAAGLLAKTGLSLALTEGLYWAAVVSQGSPLTPPTLRALLGFSRFVNLGITSGGSGRNGYSEAAVSGALPATATPATSTNVAACWAAFKAAA